MTWHLKDRKLEEKLLAIDPDFIDNLNNSVEYHKENKTVEVGFGDGIGALSRFAAEFRWGELEEIKEYNPHDWNEYPKVTPPENELMRIVCYDGTCSAGAFVDGEWHEDGTDELAHVIRFRPWED